MRFVFIITGTLIAALLASPSVWATSQSQTSASSQGDSTDPTPLGAVASSPQRAASAAQTATPQPEGEFLRVDELQHWGGNVYRLKNFATRVIRDRQEWEDFWFQAKQTPPSTLPRGKMAAVIVLGLRPSLDYNVRVVEIRRTGDDFMVSYIENKSSRPNDPRNRSTIDVIPWVVQLLPLTDGRVRFRQIGVGN